MQNTTRHQLAEAFAGSTLTLNEHGVYYTDDMKYSAKQLGEGRWAVMEFGEGWTLHEGMADLIACQEKVDSLILASLS